MQEIVSVCGVCVCSLCENEKRGCGSRGGRETGGYYCKVYTWSRRERTMYYICSSVFVIYKRDRISVLYIQECAFSVHLWLVCDRRERGEEKCVCDVIEA